MEVDSIHVISYHIMSDLLKMLLAIRFTFIQFDEPNYREITNPIRPLQKSIQHLQDIETITANTIWWVVGKKKTI